jgi:prepilin-type N-terminal cleavage/methylation domain-containing protein
MFRIGTSARSGLTLIEIVVVIVVLLILAAAIAPSLVGSLDRERVSTAATTLQEITDAMSEMRKDSQDWPGRLSHLSTAITTSDQNVCGNAYTAGKVGNWAGPYIDRVIPSTGIPVGIGTASNTVYRSSVSGQDALLTIEITSVQEADALSLNTVVDNDGDVAGRTTGTIQWSTTSSEGLVTVLYYRPIRGC